jgi:uncharacterized protein (DUF983 family)
MNVCPICNSWLLAHKTLKIHKKCVGCGFTVRTSMNEIDWTNPECMITEHFSVKEALYLPTWSRMATEADGLNDTIKQNIVNLLTIMEKVRSILGCPINVHCCFRPGLYSVAVGGTATDVHTFGEAVDL